MTYPSTRSPKPRGHRLRRAVAACAGTALVGLLSGCGLGTAGGFTPSGQLAGSLDSVPSLDGAGVAVGSKNFSEALLLGKMSIILLKSAGAEVTDLTNIPGSSSARQAMLEDQIQLMWDYTGTAWIAYMAKTDPIPDEQKQWQAVRDEDLSNGLTWLDPAPMNNTYGFAVPKAAAEKFGLSKLSDIVKVPVADQTFCVESEFKNRNDGFGPMLTAYEIPTPPAKNVKTFDTGAIYAATADGECTFGEVFTTDGRIKALDLVTLEDDRNYFPKYNVSAVVNTDTLEEHPQIATIFDTVAAELTNEVLLDLNAKIDVEGQDPAKVAWDWLVAEGFVEE